MLSHYYEFYIVLTNYWPYGLPYNTAFEIFTYKLVQHIKPYLNLTEVHMANSSL